jgi:hypothetical protein
MRTHQNNVINDVNDAVISFDVGGDYCGIVDFKSIFIDINFDICAFK